MFAGHEFIQNKEQDMAEFIIQLCFKSKNLQSSLYFDIDRHVACTQCDTIYTETYNYIFPLLLRNNTNITVCKRLSIII